jgi:FKBP-type peptidyl-prolyl cis-trans isomerase
VKAVRRVVAVPTVLCLSLLSLTACGDDDEGSGNTGSVTVTGDFGKAPTVEYDGEVNRTKTEEKVLVEGSGAKLESGDVAFVNYYIGSGYSGQKGISTWDEAPQMVTLTDEALPLKVLRDAILGHTVGSRVEVLATPKDAFDDNGNSAIHIGNVDTVLFVVDILSVPLDKPEGTTKTPPAAAPKIVEKNGKITRFDFRGSAAPTNKVATYTLIEGTGPVVKEGQTLYANYLGQIYKGKMFESSFAKNEPTSFALKYPGGVIEGWVKGIAGAKVGSRLVLVIPEKMAYGPKPKKDDGKPHGDLVFVVDILGAA